MNDKKRLLEALIPLYCIHLSNGILKGRTRLQKLVFLFQMRSRMVDYQYEKGIYGPFSYKLYTILDDLLSLGFISEKRKITVAGNEVILYELTETGKSLINFARQTKLLSQEIQKVLEEIFKEYGTLPLIELIARVYKEYPEWAEKSMFVFFNFPKRYSLLF